MDAQRPPAGGLGPRRRDQEEPALRARRALQHRLAQGFRAGRIALLVLHQLAHEQHLAVGPVEEVELLHQVGGAGPGLAEMGLPAGQHVLALEVHGEFVLEPQPIAGVLDIERAAEAPHRLQEAGVVEPLHVPVAQEGRSAGQRRDPPVERKGGARAEMVAQPLGGAAAIAQRDDVAEGVHAGSIGPRARWAKVCAVSPAKRALNV